MKTNHGISWAVICAVILSQLGSGCATTGKSVALGGAVGVGAGAIAGGIADPGRDGEYRTRNVLIGAAVGGVAGMIAGAAIQGGVDDQKKEGFQQGQASVGTAAAYAWGLDAESQRPTGGGPLGRA